MSRYHNDILATGVQIDTPDFEFRTKLVVYVHRGFPPVDAVVSDDSGGAHAAPPSFRNRKLPILYCR